MPQQEQVRLQEVVLWVEEMNLMQLRKILLRFLRQKVNHRRGEMKQVLLL